MARYRCSVLIASGLTLLVCAGAALLWPWPSSRAAAPAVWLVGAGLLGWAGAAATGAGIMDRWWRMRVRRMSQRCQEMCRAEQWQPRPDGCGDQEMMELASGIRAVLARAEEAQRQFEVAMEGTRASLWIMDVPTNHVRVNARFGEIIGFGQDEIVEPERIYDWYFDRIHPEDVPRVREALEDHLQGCSEYYGPEFRVQHKDGRWIWILARGRIVWRDEEGRPLRIAGIQLDITDLKRAEEALRESEKRFRLLFESSPFPAVVTSLLDQTVLAANRRTADVFGLPLEKAQGQRAPDFYVDATERQRMLDIVRRNGHAEDIQVHLRTADGRLFWALLSAQAIEYQGLPALLVMFNDISQRVALEEALRASERRLAEQSRALTEMTRRQTASVGDLSGRTADILEGAARTLNAQRVSMWLFEDEGQAIQCLDLYELDANRHQYGAVLWRRDSPRYFDAIERERIIPAHDAHLDPRTSEFSAHYLTPLGIGAMLDVPLRQREKCVGVLCIEHVGAARQWTVDEQNFALSVANLVAVALAEEQRARAERELQRAAEELKIAKEAAEAAARAKSEFLANMSHELRTPLNGVLGYAQILQSDSSVTPKQRECLTAIANCGEHLLGLINDVLDLSKIEAGQIRLDEVPCELSRLVGAVVNVVRPRADEKKLELKVSLDPLLPAYVMGDERRLRQVLVNLLGNAVKFTQQGTVQLSVVEEPPGRLRFAVSDTGIGIRADDLPHIFEAFRQARDGIAAGGTGLGLAISRRIVLAMGGELQVSSMPGRGSCFFFSVPLIRAEDGALRGRAEPALTRTGAVELAPGQRITALVVDDRAANRDILCRFLDAAGFTVIEAGDGQQAVELAQRHLPELVLMDVRMPVMDGLEATRRIRQADREGRTVVIAVTASAFVDTKDAVFRAGCADFITKPVREGELFSKIEKHLKVAFVPRGSAPPPAPADDGQEVLALDEERARELATRLAAATRIGDISELRRLVDELRGRSQISPALTARIARLVSAFDFDALGALAESLTRDTVAEHSDG